jgi:hypothetical protein
MGSVSRMDTLMRASWLYASSATLSLNVRCWNWAACGLQPKL